MIPMVPAHQRIAEKIARLGRQRGGICHSLLIHGPVGAGHREVAVKFGQSVFCETGEGSYGACGICRNCRRIAGKLHPDWLWLEPERKEKGLPLISIDSIRTLEDRLHLQPFEGAKVVGCLYEAEKMRVETANALLKLVEEPPAHALFILVTEYHQKILPTIRSRCLGVPVGLSSLDDLVDSLISEQGLPAEHAQQVANRSLQEGLEPAVAISESIVSLFEDSLELLDLALHRGEPGFVPRLKAQKLDRENWVRLNQFIRDLMRDCLVIAEGRGSGFLFTDKTALLQKWCHQLTAVEWGECLELSFDTEAAISGFASPVHALATLLSRISEKAQ
jgi:DNA polymerase-3 subunit delta'